MKKCKWCGSDGHSSRNCPTRNLVRFLTGEKVKADVPMPNLCIVADEDNLVATIQEAHGLQHMHFKNGADGKESCQK